jgi:hypothetical protein
MKKIIFLLVAAHGLLLTSCYKAPENGFAKITILDSFSFRQPGADVHFYGPTGSFIDDHRTTDQNGEILYEHDPALEVILHVHATYTDPSSNFHEAFGIVRITPDKTANETFVLTP